MTVNRPSQPTSLPSQAGITLVELIAALSLASIVGLLALFLFRQGRQTLLHSLGQEVDYTQAAAVSHLISQVLREGAGLKEVREDGLESVTRDGRPFQLEQPFGDTVVFLNGKPTLDSACQLKISAYGPALNPDPLATVKQDIDTLDDNRDGIIDFGELDRDRDDRLDSLELAHLRLLEIQWQSCGNASAKHRLLISPRNRVAPTNAVRDI
jgi:hypothetical protein